MKTIRHYKTVQNCFLRNLDTPIYFNGIRQNGATWYRSGPVSQVQLKKKCTLEYNEFHHSWDLSIDRIQR